MSEDLWADLNRRDESLVTRILNLRAKNDRLERTLKQGSITEIAAVNSSVFEYCKHWEGRVEKAERQLAEKKKKELHYDYILRQLPDTIRTSTWKHESMRESAALLVENIIKAFEEEFIDAATGTPSASPGADRNQR